MTQIFEHYPQKAKGEYFHVLDGDDYFTNYDKIQKQVEIMDANQHIFASSTQ